MLLIALGIVVVIGVAIPLVWNAGPVVLCPRCGSRASGPHFSSPTVEKYICRSCTKIIDRKPGS